MNQRVILSTDICKELTAVLGKIDFDKLFVLTDETTHRLCLPKIEQVPALQKAQVITIPSGDMNKNIQTMTTVWQALGQGGATRHSCLINLGGGMVTDLGGFAASTFKRGIEFVNIPTTLLAMVDASVGGKTGVNFMGLKNEIGVFRESSYVILDTTFLDTLDHENICSGYAEMLKHGLISNTEMWRELVSYDLTNPDLALLQRMVADSVAVKEHVVEVDPFEKGIRKALNFGHTFGHAIESLAMEKNRPVLHGYAVAWGMVCELYLSSVLQGFPTDKMKQTVDYIVENYGRPQITCDDYAELISLMHHDKKNTAGEINITLLGNIGDIKINCNATEKLILESYDFCREA